MSSDLTIIDSPGARLRWARLQNAQYDAAAFARSLDIKPVTYRSYESDQNGFSKHVIKLSDRLGVPAKWLLDGGPTPSVGGQHATRPPEDALPSASELADMLALLAPFLSRARDHGGGLQEIGEVLREGLAHRIANPEQPFDRTLGALEILLKRTGADRPASSAS